MIPAVIGQINCLARTEELFKPAAKEIVQFLETGKKVKKAQKAIFAFFDACSGGRFFKAVNGNTNRSFVKRECDQLKDHTEKFLQSLKEVYNSQKNGEHKNFMFAEEITKLSKEAKSVIDISNCANLALMNNHEPCLVM